MIYNISNLVYRLGDTFVVWLHPREHIEYSRLTNPTNTPMEHWTQITDPEWVKIYELIDELKQTIKESIL